MNSIKVVVVSGAPGAGKATIVKQLATRRSICFS